MPDIKCHFCILLRVYYCGAGRTRCPPYHRHLQSAQIIVRWKVYKIYSQSAEQNGKVEAAVKGKYMEKVDVQTSKAS